MSDPIPGPGRQISRGLIGELFFHTSDAVAIVDRGWVIRRWNPAGERLLGYSEDALEGRLLSVLLAAGEDVSRLRRELEGTAGPASLESEPALAGARSRAGRTFAARWRLIELDGARRAVMIQEVLPDEVDEPGRAALRQIHQLAESSARSIGETDLDRVAQVFSDLAKELLAADFTALMLTEGDPGGGLEVRSFAYNAPRHLFPDGLAHPHPVGLLRAALESRSAVRVADVRRDARAVGIPVHHPPVGPLLAIPLIVGDAVVGELLAANRAGRPAFTPLDEAIGRHLATIAAAALENARLQGRLAAQATELEEVAERRRNLVAAIAHDIRAPVGALSGYAELALDPALPRGQLPAILSRIGEQTARLNRLIDDLGTASRLGIQAVSMRIERVPVTEVVEEVVTDYRRRHPDRELSVAGQPSLAVSADRGRLQQVLVNLLENALKYSPPGSPVELHALRRRGAVAIDVHDRGPGIPEDEIPRIFDPFFRSSSVPPGAPGVGLGLTIVRGLVEAMHGRVEVDTGPGGSHFTVVLPAA